MVIQVKRTSVHCEATDHEFYQRIAQARRQDALEVPFTSMVNAFVTFACLGYHHDRYEPLNHRQEITLSVYFSQEVQLPILMSLAFARLRREQPDETTEALAKQLLSTESIFPVVEGWANGGLRMFQEATESGHQGPYLTLAVLDQLRPLVSATSAQG